MCWSAKRICATGTSSSQGLHIVLWSSRAMANHLPGTPEPSDQPTSSGPEYIAPFPEEFASTSTSIGSSSASPGEDVEPLAVDLARPPRPSWPEIVVAVLIFVAFCGIVLAKSPALLEPDDYAYRASIHALAHGDVTLTAAQYQALAKELGGSASTLPTTQPTAGPGGFGGSGGPGGPGGPGGMGGQGIMQWVKLADGSYISEKNPGYPFLALPFQMVGALRLAPLFYGGLACLALFAGLRRWAGRWAGTWAVALFCASSAAAAFAWRATMPTFTDASLIAAGVGALLFAFLAGDRSTRSRMIVGLLGFIAIEAAVAVRYTNIVFLIVAVAAALLFVKKVRLPWSTVLWWLGSVALFSLVMMWWNYRYYGHPLSTGYSSGEITFSLDAIVPNLTHMPVRLVKSMPLILLAVAALGWMVVQFARRGAFDTVARVRAGRDVVIGAVLASGWLGLWALYFAYDWTVRMAGDDQGGSIHTIRFYMPALGVIAALGAWLLVQLPRWLAPVIVVGIMAATIGGVNSLTSDSGPGGHFPGGRPDGNFGGPGDPGQPGGNSGGLMPDGYPPGMAPGENGVPGGGIPGNAGQPGGLMPDGYPPGQAPGEG